MSERVKVEKDEDMIGRKRESLKLEYAVYARRKPLRRARARACMCVCERGCERKYHGAHGHIK